MGNISLIKKNILEYLNFRGITKYKFYQATGISRGVLDKETGLTEENITKVIAAYGEINPIWLLTGKEEMLIKAVDTNKVEESTTLYIKDCNECKEKQKQINKLQDTISDLLEESKKDRELIRNLVTGRDNSINKQSRSA